MNKSEKINNILKSSMKEKAFGREHYLPDKKDSLLDPQRFFQKFPRVYRVIRAILNPVWKEKNWKKVMPSPHTHVVINLGAGTARLHPEMINMDFVKFENIDIVADLEKLPLPLKDNSVDGVMSRYVFEHIKNPEAVLEEVKRVLKPNGKLFLVVPFIYPFHEAPADFRSWSVLGLKYFVIKDFKVIEAGNRGGPFAILILTVSHMLGQLFSFGSNRLYSIVNYSTMGILFPLKYLDAIFSILPFGTNLTPSVYVIAKKK
jgi:SAM-dependent methyltransferase